jgi:hypothetical protein
VFGSGVSLNGRRRRSDSSSVGGVSSNQQPTTVNLDAELLHFVQHEVLAARLRRLGIDTDTFRAMPLAPPLKD